MNILADDTPSTSTTTSPTTDKKIKIGDDFFLLLKPPNDSDSFSGSAIVDFLANAAIIYAAVPVQLQDFPPEGVPQPGDLLGGAGALLADAFQVKYKIMKQ